MIKRLTVALFVASHVTCEIIKTKVAVLGGGMAGVIAARTLAQSNVSDFLIVETRHGLGGRMMSTEFAGVVVELGANWVQGTENNITGQANPFWDLALKYFFSHILLT